MPSAMKCAQRPLVRALSSSNRDQVFFLRYPDNALTRHNHSIGSVDFNHTRRGYQSHHVPRRDTAGGLSLAPGLASLRPRLLPSLAHLLVERHRDAARASLPAQGLGRWHRRRRPEAPARSEAHARESMARGFAAFDELSGRLSPSDCRNIIQAAKDVQCIVLHAGSHTGQKLAASAASAPTQEHDVREATASSSRP